MMMIKNLYAINVFKKDLKIFKYSVNIVKLKIILCLNRIKKNGLIINVMLYLGIKNSLI
jgi:hypothetical protein